MTKYYNNNDDGHTYYFNDEGRLFACPTFKTGALDLEEAIEVDDFEYPPSIEERKEIVKHLLTNNGLE